MKDFWTEFAKVLAGKDGPLIWGITAITVLTLGWKFLDKEYSAEGENWKVCPVNAGTNDKDGAEPTPDPPVSE